ncbi:hypothetical protein GC207_00005 [bacterium]|nr:hypothetical protein [bacterium]
MPSCLVCGIKNGGEHCQLDALMHIVRESSFGRNAMIRDDVKIFQMSNRLYVAICNNPVKFLWEPLDGMDRWEESEIDDTATLLNSNVPEVSTHALATKLVLRRGGGDLIESARSSGILISREDSFWPIWWASELPDDRARDPSHVADYLVTLWNVTTSSPGMVTERRSGRQEPPLLLNQSGPLTVLESKRCGEIMLLVCTMPVGPISNGDQPSPDKVLLAFDIPGRGFYGMNLKVRADDPDIRYRYLEWIPPAVTYQQWNPVSTDNGRRQVCLIMDRHIGDSLALLSTHFRFLREIPNVDLTVDVSRCGFLKTASNELLTTLLPGRPFAVKTEPPDYGSFDYIFDPYDLVPGILSRKLLNDSGQISLISSLEFLQACRAKKRRDILDIHLSALKRIGVISPDTGHPAFVKFSVTKELCDQARLHVRHRFMSAERDSGRPIVTIFPLGLTSDRKYPGSRMRLLLNQLHSRFQAAVFICGSDYDTPDLVDASSSMSALGSRHADRPVVCLFNEPLSVVVDLLLASDVVVAMDTGPLHLARALRRAPIALYSSKVNDLRSFMAFPWFVDDGTVEVLRPDVGDSHVRVEQIVDSVGKSLVDQSN